MKVSLSARKEHQKHAQTWLMLGHHQPKAKAFRARYFKEERSCLCTFHCANDPMSRPNVQLGDERQFCMNKDMAFKYDSGPTYIRGKYFSTSLFYWHQEAKIKVLKTLA